MFENIREAMAELGPRAISLTDKSNNVAEHYFPRAVRAVIESAITLKLAKMAHQKPAMAAVVAVVSPVVCRVIADKTANWLIEHFVKITSSGPSTEAPYARPTS